MKHLSEEQIWKAFKDGNDEALSFIYYQYAPKLYNYGRQFCAEADLVKDAIQDHLITFLNAVRRLGAEYEVTPEGIIFWRPSSLHPLQIKTAVHPGFMTDWQQSFAVLLTQASGTSTIHETIYS